jgi:hypothetical protein
MSKYSLDQLKQKLISPGWQMITGNKVFPVIGTLAQMAEIAHTRRTEGKAVGYLQEIGTKIEIDMLQLEELWQHMGLPTI